MILTDTGPLVALIDKAQGDVHRKCIAAQRKLKAPMLTTWPCLAEAMYLLSQLRGWDGQQALWSYIEKGTLVIRCPSDSEIARMRVLMEKYRDTPMDLADASLVAAAETLGVRKILTLDSDFFIYRINDKDSFDVVPLN